MANYMNMLQYQVNRLIVFFIFLAIVIIVLMCIALKCKAKEILNLLWMASLALAIMFCIKVLPVVNDIKNETVITTEVEWYYRYPNGGNRHNWFDRGHVIIFTNGKKIQLELPYGNTEEKFPMGKYTGTVVYAKHSKLILYFEPTRTE